MPPPVYSSEFEALPNTHTVQTSRTPEDTVERPNPILRERSRPDRSGVGHPADGFHHSHPAATTLCRSDRHQESPVFSKSCRRSSRLSYGVNDAHNAILHGDNIAILRDLNEHLSGAVNCVYLDPPYNNNEYYHHYSDKSRHDEWLKDICVRLELIKPLLSPNGSLWISIDDAELHYLKVAVDQLLGRRNFVSTIVWQQRTTRENRRVFSNNHEYVLVYAPNPTEFKSHRNLLPPTIEQLARYKNPDADPRGPWQSVSANVQSGHGVASQYYRLTAPNGRVHWPPEGRCWVYNRARMRREIAAGNIWFGKHGNGVPRIKKFLRDGSKIGLTPETLWTADQVGTTDEAKKQLLQLFPEEPIFDTPKPERLLARILSIATNASDLVLDAYLGSGTTAAVAHKMNRRYIGIEKGDQAVTYCAARLKMVVDGDGTGISKDVGWRGGGGFQFYVDKRRGRR